MDGSMLSRNLLQGLESKRPKCSCWFAIQFWQVYFVWACIHWISHHARSPYLLPSHTLLHPSHLCILYLPFWNILYQCRKETILVFLANLFRAANSANLSFSTALVNFLIFVTYALGTGNSITSKMVFTTMPLITYVRMLTFYYIVEAVLGVREIKVAIKRIQVRTAAESWKWKGWVDNCAFCGCRSWTCVTIPSHHS